MHRSLRGICAFALVLIAALCSDDYADEKSGDKLKFDSLDRPAAGTEDAASIQNQNTPPRYVINVMAPLQIGNPLDPNSYNGVWAWEEFRSHLKIIKRMGVTAVTTDIWWGLVQNKSPDDFNWVYFDKLAQIIKEEGLGWIPILSTHSLGGNVGDSAQIQLPEFIRELLSKNGFEDLRYQSEAGIVTEEVIPAWSSKAFLPYYHRFYSEFLKRYGVEYVDRISEIIVSLGPAGELVYPSYHNHDRLGGVKNSEFPNRGTLQAYSKSAQASFRKFLKEKYNSIDELNAAWASNFKNFDQTDFVHSPKELQAFIDKAEQFTAKGRDFFDWYRDSLLDHGYTLIQEALNVFHNNESPLKNVAIGVKVPGIHWRVFDPHQPRIAELTAGLISSGNSYRYFTDEEQIQKREFLRKTAKKHRVRPGLFEGALQPTEWQTLQLGRGYRPIFEMLRKVVSRKPNTKIHLHFTCGEIPNGSSDCGSGCHGGQISQSGGQFLVETIGYLSNVYATSKPVGVPSGKFSIKTYLENALGWSLYDAGKMNVLWTNLTKFGFSGVTFLRLGEVVKSQWTNKFCQSLLLPP